MAFIIAQRNRISFLFLGLLALTILSFGSILFLSFGWDDYTSLYYAIHNKLYPYPYHADQFRLMPLFLTARLSPMPYYAVSLALFFVDAVILALFVATLTRRYWLTLATSMFFIVSYVGSDGMYYAVEGLRNTQFVIVLLGTLLVYYLFRKNKNRLLYSAAFVGFSTATAVFPYRAFSMLALILIMDRFGKKTFDNLRSVFVRLLPFILIDVAVYVVIPKLPGVKNALGHIHPTSFLTTSPIRHIQNFSLTWFYLMIPDTFLSRFPNILQVIGPLASWIGTIMFVATGAVVFGSGKSDLTRFTRLSFLLLSTMLASFVLIVNDYFVTNYRYLLVVRPLAAMAATSLLFHLLSPSNRRLLANKVLMVLLGCSFFLHLLEHGSYQAQVVYRRGSFAKKVVATIRKHVPTIRGKTLFFLDSDDNEHRDRFVEALRVGTLPTGASLAVYYGTEHENIEVIDRVHCDNFPGIFETWRNKPVDVYYFSTDGENITLGPKEKAFERCSVSPSVWPVSVQ